MPADLATTLPFPVPDDAGLAALLARLRALPPEARRAIREALADDPVGGDVGGAP